MELPVGDFRQCPQQHLLPFPCRCASRQHDDRLILGKRDAVDKPDNAGLRHRGRIKYVNINAALDHRKAITHIIKLCPDL